MTCLWVRSSSAIARSTNTPSRATASSASATPSRRTPVQPGAGTMASRGTTRTRSPASRHAQASSATMPRADASRWRIASVSGPPSRSRSASHPSMTRADVPQPRRDLRGVGRGDPGAHLDVSSRQPRHARPAAGGEGLGGRPVRPRIADRARDGLDERRRQHQRQVADRGHERDRARRPSSARPARRRRWPAPSTRSRASASPAPAGSTITHGRPRNSVDVGGVEPARLPPGHRVAADEPQALVRRRCEDRGLGARDVRDHGARREGLAQGSAEPPTWSRQSSGDAASTTRSAPSMAAAGDLGGELDDPGILGDPRRDAGRRPCRRRTTRRACPRGGRGRSSRR